MENKFSLENSLIKQKKNKYAQELIGIVWERFADQGIENADNLIGTRETIENQDFKKFWSNVSKEDVENLISAYGENKKRQLDNFEIYKEKYGEGGFVPEIGEMISLDTSWWDNKIQDLNDIIKTL